MKNTCKCMHHGINKVLLFLVLLSAVGFWWSSAFDQKILWMDSDHFFKDVVILSLLSFVSKYCGCCGLGGGMGGNGMCNHNSDCKCGDCGMCK